MLLRQCVDIFQNVLFMHVSDNQSMTSLICLCSVFCLFTVEGQPVGLGALHCSCVTVNLCLRVP